ncbi:hypothetical protein K2F40_13785 [Clostridium sp. CM028]|uniref:hypothetical protein n=1 Tax=unclassified Clostridium TaxID=2614128 RepID=UPI001C0E3AD2|nr:MULTISPECIES: hypothetical protein [unclassified Clostridium]MBU3092512.1 hypothetical protein [Clostridium sp. CF011]MBW9150028.1 hypothetical protein [Clostridium sp. CM028]WAG68798.1 hypothetical protein LL036_11915 [Clostridium sp. CF011]WLC60572.1 hypothetical protein KTC94_10210 [Clostridium sp. CM028]
MIKNKSKLIIFCFIIITSFIFTGCKSFDVIKVKLGVKNVDFDYIEQGRIKKIIIQSTRDKSFRFVVTDEIAIKDLHKILSSAKEVNEKSTLEADYIFEMYEGVDKVHKFSYIAGLDKKDGANLYSADKSYIVSKRIDNDIIENFWNIRKPIDFETVYYDSILKVLDKYIKDDDKSKKIFVDISEDNEVAKFILSTDLESFKSKLLNDFNALLVKDKNTGYDELVSVKTEGYKSTIYKSSVTIKNKANEKEKKYYVVAKYDKGWNIEIFEDEKPKGF